MPLGTDQLLLLNSPAAIVHPPSCSFFPSYESESGKCMASRVRKSRAVVLCSIEHRETKRVLGYRKGEVPLGGLN